MLLVILFMGHGLVEVPRGLWRSADRRRALRVAEVKAVELKDNLYDAEIELQEAVATVSRVSYKVRPSSELRSYVDQIIEKCPLVSSGQNIETNHARLPREITLRYLNNLHRQIIRVTRQKERYESQWRYHLKRVFLLQDILENESSSDKRFHSTVKPLSNGRYADLERILMWWWYIRLQPLLSRLLAIAATLMSVSLIWSEITFMSKEPVLSIFGIIYQAAGNAYGTSEWISFLTIAYMCTCVYTSLFKLKIFNLYALVPNHNTNENSLLFFGAYLCRLTYPLCYNYLNLISHEQVAVFSQFMGKINLVPLLGHQFNDWVPLLILFPVLVTFFNIHGRVLGAFNIGEYFEEDEEGSDSADTEEGRLLILDARSALERKIQGSDRGVLFDGRDVEVAQHGRRPRNSLDLPSVDSTAARVSFDKWKRSRSPQYSHAPGNTNHAAASRNLEVRLDLDRSF
ncbi:LMBR1-domain-containing protein [Basidiobolus meristosporus CBS 931.73]|nr:LMBR1-domain-containing protein [Basidiobolus meristosporus CBS 931.73]|eukprot:ORX89968.1 LMBR1-domain-containing protein [Basidiobolus meristosporus CBS 931.73]